MAKRTTENMAISTNEAVLTPATHTQKPVGKKVARKVNEKTDANLNAIVEHAFVPEAGQVEKTQIEKVRDFNEEVLSLDDIVLESDYEGTPCNGLHKVTMKKAEHVAGKLGNFTAFTFRTEDGMCWSQNVSWGEQKQNIKQKFEELKNNNNGIGRNLGIQTFINLLIKKEITFKVFTIIGTDANGVKKLYTYFDEGKYQKRCYVETNNQIKMAEKEESYQEWKRANAEA